MASAVRAAARAPSKLTKILAQLNAAPKLGLNGIKTLKLTYAYRNDHWGARHFAKEHLPRIRWANPDLDIQVEKALKTASEEWRPELEVQFENGKQQVFNLQGKWSSVIVKELMEVAGGSEWQKYKAEALSAGKPLIPGEEYEPTSPSPSKTLPSLANFRQRSGQEQSKAKAAPIPEAPATQQPSASA